MVLFYNLGIFLYYSAIRLAGFFSPKAKEWHRGRSHIWQTLETKCQALIDRQQPVIWIHCASLGEFEQGRPVAERIKQQHPDYQIVISFFSPSGYTIRKNYETATLATYLPLDTAKNAARFLDIIQPDIAVFVKYEYWYHYLTTLQKRNIPTLLISAIFRNNQLFFKPYGQLHKKMLSCFSQLFVQDKMALNVLNQHHWTNVTLAGDTRVDRVKAIVKAKKTLPKIASFSENAPVFVAGSSWQKDEVLLFELMKNPAYKDWKWIIAPHEIDEVTINRIVKQCPLASVLYSEWTTHDTTNKVLIINNIGMLSSLYAYGDVAYIGGGFGSGIHNTLEPIAHGLPVIFGPKYQRFTEAVALIETGGGFSIKSAIELEEQFARLNNIDIRKKAGQIAYQYIEMNSGATEKVVEYIQQIVAK